MTSLSSTRCFVHGGREASGMCLTCHNFYCRECLVVLEGRLTCASCMVPDAKETSRTSIFRKAFSLLNFAWGIFVLWFLFYCVGRILLTIPEMFHTSFLS